MVDVKSSKVGAPEPLRASFKSLMKHQPIITALLSQCTESTPTFPAAEPAGEDYTSFTYKVRAVSHQMTPLYRQATYLSAFSLVCSKDLHQCGVALPI